MTSEEAMAAAIDKVNTDFDDAGVSGYMAHLVLDALRAAGWAVVPVEATADMVHAGVKSMRAHKAWSHDIAACYRDMLAAAARG